MASVTVTELKINGVVMPPPALQGVTITTEKIWSSDTGRTSSGRMVGTMVAKKSKIAIKWPALTMEQAETIEAAVSGSGAFVPMEYTDMGGKTVKKTVYFGTPTYTIYSLADGFQYILDASVDGIEQ